MRGPVNHLLLTDFQVTLAAAQSVLVFNGKLVSGCGYFGNDSRDEWLRQSGLQSPR